MAKTDEYAQGNAPLQTEEAQRQLLKKSGPQPSLIITRSTAEHFPLPSVVPSTQLFPERPVTRRPAEIQSHKPQESAPPVQVQPAAAIAIPQNLPAVNPAPSRRPDSREHSIRSEKPAENNEQQRSESWVGNLSQRVRSTLGQNRETSATDGSTKPDNQAEVAYNPQGSVDYVTYTINAPAHKKRERSR